MEFSSQIQQSLRQASQWLVSIRKEKNEWSDMVYKQQGIVNTAEAWLCLAEIDSITKQVEWERAWLEADCQRLATWVTKHGFVRSPYCPADRLHESVDAAAFVILMLQSMLGGDSVQASKPMARLQNSATAWLLKNQSPAGGWSWGPLQDGCPLYPYFTYMAIGALRTVEAKETQKAVKSGVNWLIDSQRSDGSFAVYSNSSAPDVASTAYASLALCPMKNRKAQAALKRAVRYLLSASFSLVTQVGHLKIVEPSLPPQRQVDYENYSVAANVLLALVKARLSRKDFPQLVDRIQFFAQYLLEEQAPVGGWPKSYATIYTTHTTVSALAAYLSDVHNQLQSRPDQISGHDNPYIFGFPIQQPHLFFGRQATIERIRADMKTGPALKRDLALVGERRIGKTSLLYQLPFHLEPDGHRVFYLDLELMQSARQFLQTFLVKLGEAVFRTKSGANMNTMFLRAMENLDRKPLRELDLELQLPFLKLSTTQTEDMFTAFLGDVERLLVRFRKWHTGTDAKLICLLDEIAYLQKFAEGSLQSLLRGIAQQLPDLVFIVSGTPKACQILTTEASPLYNIFTPIYLGQLERDDAMALIKRPVAGKITYTPEAVERLLQTAKRQPYALQALCYYCIRALPSDQTQVNEQIVSQAIEAWQTVKDWK